MVITDIIIYCGGVATAITSILILMGKILSKLKTMSQTFEIIQRHTEENYLTNLRLTIMSDEMPIGERLNAGRKYIEAGGNGEVKAYYEILKQNYQKQLAKEGV